MQLVLDDEQQQLRSTVRKLLTDHAPSDRVREVMDGPDGYDHQLWQRLSGELGLAGLVVPEEYDGSGAGHVERCVVLEELGRALTPSPFFASAVLAVDALLALDDLEVRAEMLPRLASGQLLGAVALASDDGVWGSTTTSVRASQRDGAWVLDGHASFVVSGESADIVLVYAATPSGPGWFVVSGRSAGFAGTAMSTLDPTRRLARLEFTATSARPVTSENPAAALERIRDLAVVALAAEQVGGMRRVLEMTADYAKVRVQFGRTIGSYQAVKHGCADMYSACEQATSALRHAAWAADHDAEALPLAAATSQVFIGPACFQVAADGLQLHGGVGYTWEHDAHLYYKRAKTSEVLFGDAERGHAQLADRLGI